MPKTNQEFLLLPLFQKYIAEIKRGKHLQSNGKRIKPGTIDNYYGLHRLLSNFSIAKQFPLRIKTISGIKKK